MNDEATEKALQIAKELAKPVESILGLGANDIDCVTGYERIFWLTIQRKLTKFKRCDKNPCADATRNTAKDIVERLLQRYSNLDELEDMLYFG